MKTHTFLSALAILAAPALLPAQDAARPLGQQQPSAAGKAAEPAQPGAAKAEALSPVTEEEFLKTAAKSGNHEVMVASLAAQKAKDKKVKTLAQMLFKDHTAANKNLAAVAKELKVPLQLEDPEAKAKYDALGAKTGADFDNAFVEEMKMGHQKSIALFESAKASAKSKGVIAFIDKTLPVIKGHAEKLEHLKMGTTAAAKKPSGNDASQAPSPK